MRVEPAGTTLDRAGRPSTAPAPLWAHDRSRSRRWSTCCAPHDPVGYTTEPLASSQLTIATADGRARRGARRRRAPTPPLWACIGDHAGAPWTDLGGDASFGARSGRRSGVVDREAVALASFADAVAGYIGSPAINAGGAGRRPGVHRRGCGAWPAPSTSGLSAGTPLATMVTRAGSLDIAATTVAERRRPCGVAADLSSTLSYPEPVDVGRGGAGRPRAPPPRTGWPPTLTAELGAAGWGARALPPNRCPTRPRWWPCATCGRDAT